MNYPDDSFIAAVHVVVPRELILGERVEVERATVCAFPPMSLNSIKGARLADAVLGINQQMQFCRQAVSTNIRSWRPSRRKSSLRLTEGEGKSAESDLAYEASID